MKHQLRLQVQQQELRQVHVLADRDLETIHLLLRRVHRVLATIHSLPVALDLVLLVAV